MVSPQLERLVGIALVLLGAALFVVFGVLKGAFGDVGVYAISVVPIVLGLGLMWRASAASVLDS